MIIVFLAFDPAIDALKRALKCLIHNPRQSALHCPLEHIGDRKCDTALVTDLREAPERRIGVDERVCGPTRDCEGKRSLLDATMQRRLNGKRNGPSDPSRRRVAGISSGYFRRFAAAGLAGLTAGFDFKVSGLCPGTAFMRKDGTPVMIPS
jgi:hypothetical protein